MAYGHYPVDPGTEDQVTYSEGIYVGYRYFDTKKVKPLFPFGFGLSYSSFRFENLSTRVSSGNDQSQVEVSFDLTNTGASPAAEVAQLYVSPLNPRIDRPIQELKKFQRMALRPGEKRRMSFTLDRNAFAYFDPSQHDWRADPGIYEIRIGSSSRDLPLTAKFELP